tara:strand:- start:41 stop:403 length:363 start_codon:yes stop_codon:yes gene_type:complete
MSQNIRRIGDNQNPIQDQAIRLIKEINDNVFDAHQHAQEAFMGKNKTIRDNNALMSAVKMGKILQRLASWFKVIEAKDNGEDIHSAPIKTHKLNIVADRHNEFGQYVVDKAAWEVLNGKK